MCIRDRPNAEGERYGEARIIAQLEEGRGRTPEQLVRAVMDDVMEWGGAPTDDCTLLVLRM